MLRISGNRLADRWQTNAAGIPVLPPTRRAVRRRGLENLVSAALIIGAIVLSSPALSASARATQLFRSGQVAFEEGDYAAALAAFYAATQAGLEGPAVHFNLGVTAFRLGRYELAKAAFLEVARAPEMAALAHYNLGLVALRDEDSDAAAMWFERAAAQANDERLRTLAERRLTSLPARPAPRFLGYGSMGLGYDDNVALVSDSDVLGVSGADAAFLEGQFAVSSAFAAAWRVDAGLMFVDYQDLDSFDQLTGQGAARYRILTDAWTNELGLQLAYTALDGEGFDNTRTLFVQSSRELPAQWQIRLRYRFSDIDGMNDFSEVGGERHETTARADLRRGPWDIGFEYQLEVSDHEGRLLSARRNRLAFDLRRDLTPQWSVAADAAFRHSDYDANENGQEERLEIGLAVMRTLQQRWRIFMRYRYVDNSSDLAEFSYEGNRIVASIEALL